MKTTIFKYRESEYGNNNYFIRNTALGFVDKFITYRNLENGFPIFREELTDEENVNNIKTGYFDLKLSMIMSERSELLNKSILEFFENLDIEVSKYKFIVACETNSNERSYCGTVDISNLKTDESITGNQMYLYCSVIGIETEFVDLLQTTKITKILANQKVDSEYINTMLYWADPAKLNIRSQLHLLSKLGFDLTIDRGLLENLWNSNLDPTGTFCIISNWDAFRSFLVGYQFKFKVVFTHNTNSGPVFNIVLFFRSEGLNITSVPKIISPGRSLIYSGVQWISIFYTHRVDAQNEKLEHFSGVIMNRNNVYVSNDIIYNNEERYYQVNNITFREDLVEIQKIDLTMFHTTLLAEDVAICKLVPGHSIDSMLNWIANHELKYYLKALKKKKNYKLKVDQFSNFSIGSKTVIDGTSYVVDRINSLDNSNETMEAEFVEI